MSTDQHQPTAVALLAIERSDIAEVLSALETIQHPASILVTPQKEL